uniref:Uncharacterized protein n=1 Tax=Wuchereria bancrofti TaxID=6293 RepID=A0AAF5RUI5_WUCBA
MNQQIIHILMLLLLIIVTVISARPQFLPSANYDCIASPSLNGYSTWCGYNWK